MASGGSIARCAALGLAWRRAASPCGAWTRSLGSVPLALLVAAKCMSGVAKWEPWGVFEHGIKMYSGSRMRSRLRMTVFAGGYRQTVRDKTARAEVERGGVVV